MHLVRQLKRQLACPGAARLDAQMSPILLPLPHPAPQWFVYFLTGPTAELQVVSLASQTSAPASLTANPPGGVTGALKLVTLDATYKDKAYAGVLFPPAELSSTPGSPAQGGLFGGVRRLGGLLVNLGAAHALLFNKLWLLPACVMMNAGLPCTCCCLSAALRCHLLLHRSCSRRLQTMPGVGAGRAHAMHAQHGLARCARYTSTVLGAVAYRGICAT